MSKNNIIVLVLAVIVVLAAAALYGSHKNGTTSGIVATTTDSGAMVNSGTTGITSTNPAGGKNTGGTTPAPVPYITKFLPPAGTPGTTVTIVGTGFSKTENYVMFGPTADRHHLDGTPDNQIAKVSSPDGTTLTFTVPMSGPSGQLCDTLNHCVAISSILISPGNYPVRVRTQGGLSNPQTFIVTK